MNTTVLPSMLDRDPATMPLEEIDISYIDLWKNDAKWPFFKRLRDEAPVHCRNSEYGAFGDHAFEDIMPWEKLGNIFFLSTNFDWRSGRGQHIFHTNLYRNGSSQP